MLVVHLLAFKWKNINYLVLMWLLCVVRPVYGIVYRTLHLQKHKVVNGKYGSLKIKCSALPLLWLSLQKSTATAAADTRPQLLLTWELCVHLVSKINPLAVCVYWRH